MPDISLCENNTCPSRKSCYRYTAEPNPYRQTYSLFEVKDGSDKCESYIANLTPNSIKEVRDKVKSEFKGFIK